MNNTLDNVEYVLLDSQRHGAFVLISSIPSFFGGKVII